jgi:putative toxin-antitoxin system antitoxin component (TIGR02293 family)
LPPLSIDAVIQRAADVIGDRAEAMRWLGTPIRALDYATPIALLHEVREAERVLAVLTQLEHGVL